MGNHEGTEPDMSTPGGTAHRAPRARVNGTRPRSGPARFTPRTRLRLGIVLAGLTQRQLADRCHMSDSRMSGIVRGRITPTMAEMKRIAKLLDKSVRWLFGAATVAAAIN